MKKLLAVPLIVVSLLSIGQNNQPNNLPDSFSMVAHEYNLGWCTFEFYKYNVRTPDFEIWDWDMSSLTPKSIPEIRTYRGRIAEHPNWKIFAVWLDDNTISIKGLKGKGVAGGHFNIDRYEMDTVVLGVTHLQPSFSNQSSEYLLTTGHTPSYNYLHNNNPKGPQGSWETCVAMFEHVVNVADWHLTRDLGVSKQIGLVVIPTNPSIGDNFINPINYSNQLKEVNCWWRTKQFTGGGTTRKFFNNSSWNKGMFGMTRMGSPAFSHEFGHQLDCGHYHNQKDTQHSNHYYMGRNTVAISKDHLNHPNNSSVINPISNYTDPVHPWCAQDYVHVKMNNSIVIDVLANDTDYNYDTITLLSCDQLSEKGGSLTISGNKIVYSPPAGFVGNDKFNYIAQSGTGNGYFTNYSEVLIEVQNPLCDLALRYSFDNINSQIIEDEGWGVDDHNGTLHFTNFTNALDNGIHGDALKFDGVTSLRTDDILNPLDESMSISIWVKPDSVADNEIGLIYDSGSKGVGSHAGISIGLNSDGTAFFVVQPEAKDYEGAILWSVYPINMGQWNHFVLVIDRNDNILKAYVNNQEVTYSPNIGNNDRYFKPNHIIKGYPGLDRGSIQERVATCFGHLTMQKLNAPNIKPYYGSIDEFRIYTKALTSAEVSLLYSNPIDTTIGACVNPVIHVYDTIIACDAHTWIDGNTYLQSNNTAIHSYVTPLGYDSIVHLELIINQSPSILVGGDIEECYPYEFIPNASADIGNITWSGGLINGASVVPSVGLHSYVVSADNLGCIKSDTINVVIYESPTVFAGNDLTECFPFEYTLNASSNVGNIVWSGGMVNGQSLEPTVGSHTYIASADNMGCIDSDTVHLIIHEYPSVFAGSDLNECYPFEFTPNATTNLGNITWSDGLVNGQALIPLVGSYNYVATADNEGCVALDSINVIINECTLIEERILNDKLHFDVYDITGRILNKEDLPLNQILLKVYSDGKIEKIYLNSENW